MTKQIRFQLDDTPPPVPVEERVLQLRLEKGAAPGCVDLVAVDLGDPGAEAVPLARVYPDGPRMSPGWSAAASQRISIVAQPGAEAFLGHRLGMFDVLGAAGLEGGSPNGVE